MASKKKLRRRIAELRTAAYLDRVLIRQGRDFVDMTYDYLTLTPESFNAEYRCIQSDYPDEPVQRVFENIRRLRALLSDERDSGAGRGEDA